LSERTQIGLQALAKSVTWTLLSAFIGLAQIVLLYALTRLVKTAVFPDIIRDGVLLFVAMAFIAGITLDYWVGNEPGLPRWGVGLLFALFPFLIGFFVAGSYVAMFLVSPTDVNYDVCRSAQYWALAVSFLYAIVCKFMVYLQASIRETEKPV
jgi:hypothetical protein